MFFRKKISINPPTIWLSLICQSNAESMHNLAAREALVLYMCGSLQANVSGGKKSTLGERRQAYATSLARCTPFAESEITNTLIQRAKLEHYVKMGFMDYLKWSGDNNDPILNKFRDILRPMLAEVDEIFNTTENKAREIETSKSDFNKATPEELRQIQNRIDNDRAGIEPARRHLEEEYEEGGEEPGEQDLWIKAAEKGNSVAQFKLGIMYQHSEGVAEDAAEAVKWYRKAADQGNSVAQYNLGAMYHCGESIAEDAAEAFKWFRKAAEQGYSNASVYAYELSFTEDTEDTEDTSEAAKWCRKAAEQGHATAQFNLGVAYANGQGVSEDATEAVKWYRKAAEQGDADAQFNLGIMYYNGEGVPEDDVEAYIWFNLAAAQGHEVAKENKGIISKEITCEQIADAQKLSLEWLEEFGGGIIEEYEDEDGEEEEYEGGEDDEDDEDEGEEELELWEDEDLPDDDDDDGFSAALFEKATNGDADALLALSEIEDPESIRLYLKMMAAANGNSDAAYHVALSFLSNDIEGLTQDGSNHLACYFFQVGALQGHVESHYELAKLYKESASVDFKFRCVKWYEEAINLGHSNAAVELADVYARGHIVPKDFIAAYMWLNVAVSIDSNDEAIRIRDEVLSNKMTREQIAEAQKMPLLFQ